MAEGILREKLKQYKVDAVVDSCGFESFHAGDKPDPRALAVAARRGIDLSSHRGRLFTIGDFDRFDRIYAMDSSHFTRLKKLSRNESDMAKVDYVLNVLHPGQNLSVVDPWYYDEETFEKVYLQLEKACEMIAGQVTGTIKK